MYVCVACVCTCVLCMTLSSVLILTVGHDSIIKCVYVCVCVINCVTLLSVRHVCGTVIVLIYVLPSLKEFFVIITQCPLSKQNICMILAMIVLISI